MKKKNRLGDGSGRPYKRGGFFPLLAVVGIAVAGSVWAAEPAPETTDIGLWARDSLTGNWEGWRARLADRGLTIGISEVAEVLGNTSGGQKSGTVFAGRAELAVDLDLEKLVGWKGATIHANGFQIHGRGLTADTLGGNLFDPSNIEADRATRLFDAYFEQRLFDDTVSLRIGQLAADDSFLTSDYASVLINGTFGWAGIMAADLPNGGPAYPLATPGVRIMWSPSAALSWQTAVYNGDPAGRCNDDAQICNPDGLTFSTHQDAFVISEITYAVADDETVRPVRFKLGGWYHTGMFDDLRYDADGGLLAMTGANPRQKNGDYGFYAVVETLFWRELGTSDQGLGVFFRIGGAPGDRNLVPFYFDVGLHYVGPFAGREADEIGLGFALAKISDRARDFDRDYNLANPSATRPVRDYEAVLELSYSYVAAPWWTIQPDIQYILHPAANSADPDTDVALPATAMKNALILGVRTAIQL